MKNPMFPVTALGVLLLAGFGATKAGRAPNGTGEAAQRVGVPSGRAKTAAPNTRRPQADTCAPGRLCDDPVVRSGKLAKQEADDTLKETICDFLAEFAEHPPAGAGTSTTPADHSYCSLPSQARPTRHAGKGRGGQQEVAADSAVRPKVVLAILPDPVHTQLALRFDESMDELQNSLQDLGWTYDHGWLPWDDKEHEDVQDFDERMDNKTAQEQYENSAGAILFRPSSTLGPRQPMVVLVVGDTPTGGVNPEEFRNAIQVWQQLTGSPRYFAGKPSTQAAKGEQFSGGKAQPRAEGDNSLVKKFSHFTLLDSAEQTPALPEAAHLEILGPTYSGSQPSLKGLLRELGAQTGTARSANDYVCPRRPFEITIVSGTVSDGAELEALENDPTDECPLTVHPSSLAVDLTYEYQRVLYFLDSHLGRRRSSFAVLSEAESSFGDILVSGIASKKDEMQSVLDRINRQLTYSRLTPEERLRREDLREESLRNLDAFKLRDLKEDTLQDLTGINLFAAIAPRHYYFPREISKLRAAYEQNNIFGFTSGASSVQTQLHLSLSGSTRGDDTVHSFSGSQAAAAMEAQMAQLAVDLERTRTTLVLLSATDVLDEIFVTRYLAQHAPNVGVVVTDTDGLFLRSGDSSMANAYVVSPWPLIPANEEWSADPRDRNLPQIRYHASAGAQGLYGAVRMLLCSSGAPLLTGCGSVRGGPQQLTLREYQPPIATEVVNADSTVSLNTQKLEPPIWLSVIGHGGFWPIALVDIDQVPDKLPNSMADNLPQLVKVGEKTDGTEMNVPAIQSAGILEPDPRGITLGTGLVALLLALHGLACMRARLDRGYAWSYALSDKAHHRLRQGLQIAITLSAVPALVLLKTPIEAGIFVRSGPYTFFNWLLQIAAVLITLWPLGLLSRAWPWPPITPAKALPRFILALFAEIVFVALCNWRLWDVIAPSRARWPTERAFFFYRSAHMFCGSAPSLPVLLLGAALVWYMVSVFDRLVFYRNRIPVLPKSDPDLRCPGRKEMKPLNRLLSHGWGPWRYALFTTVALLMTLFVLGLSEIIPRSLTHGRFDETVIGFSALVVFLMLYDLCVAITAWYLLRGSCLLPLSRSPLRWGFTWIKGWSWKRLWAPGTVSADGVLEHVRRLNEANRRAIEEPILTQTFAGARQMFEQEPRDENWASAVTESVGHLNRQLALSATRKLQALKALWQSDHGPITGSNAPERGLPDEVPLERRDPAPPPSPWTDTLDRTAREEFVALLYLGYIRMVLLQIRNRIMTASGMFIFLLWALTCYPFLNHHYIVVALASLLFVLAFTVTWIYSQMYRDDILSRTTETASGKLDSEFFTKMLGMVGLPMLTLVASQFPEVSNVVFSWLEPGLSSMK